MDNMITMVTIVMMVNIIFVIIIPMIKIIITIVMINKVTFVIIIPMMMIINKLVGATGSDQSSSSPQSNPKKIERKKGEVKDGIVRGTYIEKTRGKYRGNY